MTHRSVELRSDTFTRPSPEMRRAMAEAEVGDDVWNEDPTVTRLEQISAALVGKEAGLFVTSGTQGNLVGILAHTQRAQEIIAGDESHVFLYELAGTAAVGGLQVRTVPNRKDGRLRPDDILAAIRSTDIHEPPTGCICVENTHNRCGGAVIKPNEMAEIAELAHSRSIPIHLDGARVFNAATALKQPVTAITRHVDSLTFCLSKGLGAPIGSVLCGTEAYIERARRWRKLLGGGMRQVGVIAAAGLYALDRHIDRLAEDNANAKHLATGLAQIPGIEIDPSTVESNLVFFDETGLPMSHIHFIDCLAEKGIRVSGAAGRIRAVTSLEVTTDDIDYALSVIRQVAIHPIPSAV